MCEAGIYVPISEAARMLQTTELRILMMLKRQELQGRQEADTWLVEKASLQMCGTPTPEGVARSGGCGGSCGNGCAGH